MQVITNTHPVVRTHPETGEKILYVNEAHTLHFEGWSEEESQELLNYLYKHSRKPEFQCRYKWTLGAVTLWDNRATHHYPVNDYTGSRRLLHRVSIKGERPR
jgi:taurine dioxygenase